MFKRFFHSVAHFFKNLTNGSEQVVVEHSDDAIEVDVETSESEMYTSPVVFNKKPQIGVFGWVVGHNSKATGANNYLKESEFSFSSRILRKAQSQLKDRGYDSVVIFRPPVKSYKKQVRYVAKVAKEMGVTHAILSHFNDAGSTARGCECLITKTRSLIDNKMADKITDDINEVFGIKERKDDGVSTISDGHGGAGMLNALNFNKINATLAEPVFAGYKNKDSKAVFENEDKYVKILVDTAEACCNGTIEAYTKD